MQLLISVSAVASSSKPVAAAFNKIVGRAGKVKHGTYAGPTSVHWHSADFPLTEDGRKTAMEIKKKLQKEFPKFTVKFIAFKQKSLNKYTVRLEHLPL